MCNGDINSYNTNFTELSAHHWKTNNENKLLNISGQWQYQDNTWTTIPSAEEPEGYIKNSLGQFLSIKDESVTLLDPKDFNSHSLTASGQKWQKIMVNDGYFTLRNPISGKFLTATNPTSVKVTGM